MLKLCITKSLGLAGLAFIALHAQEERSFKVYGFMDTQMEVYDLGTPFLTEFLGNDELDLFAAHANVYFDWQANSRVKALAEVNFLGKRSSTNRSDAMGAAAFSINGNLVSDQQMVAMVGSAIAAQFPAGTPQTYVDSVVAAQTSTLASTFAAIRQGTVQESEVSTDQERVTLERAYFDVSLTDMFNVRVGKFITPAGIWNVDHGSPVVLTVRQPIQTTITPIFPESQTGLMMYGRYFLGDHDLDYSIYGTSGRDGASGDITSSFNNSTDGIDDLSMGGHLGLQLDLLDGVHLGASGMMGRVQQRYKVATPVLDGEQVIGVLTSGASASQIQSQLASMSPLEIKYTDEYAVKAMDYICGMDAKVELAGLTTQGELNYRMRQNRKVGGYDQETWGMYGLLAYRLPLTTDLSMTPYGMAERVLFKGSDKSSPVRGFNTYLAGLNFGLFSSIHLKTEVDYFQFLAQDGSASLPSDLDDKDLEALIYNVQLSVAF